MNNKFETEYKALVTRVIDTGDTRPSRVGTTKSVFATALKIRDLNFELFPVITGRKMYVKPVLGELAAFLAGAETLQEFKDFGCNYWDANAAEWAGNLGLAPKDHLVGRIYGVQWRQWNKQLDQLSALISSLKTDPFSRRHILTTWNPSELPRMCLPPCHLLAQFQVIDVHDTRFLDCIVTMRSVDLCLGLPSDIVLYSTLLILIAQTCGMRPGNLTFMMGDSHVYENHITTWYQQEAAPVYDLPTYALDPAATLDNFHPEMLTLLDYVHGPALKYALNT